MLAVVDVVGNMYKFKKASERVLIYAIPLLSLGYQYVPRMLCTEENYLQDITLVWIECFAALLASVTIVCYIRIFIVIKKRQNRQKQSNSINNHLDAPRSSNKTTKMLAILMGT